MARKWYLAGLMTLAVAGAMAVAADDATKSFVPADYKGTVFTDEKMTDIQKAPGKIFLAYYDKGGSEVAYHYKPNKNLGSDGLNKGGKDYVDTFRRSEGISTSYTKDFADKWEGQKAFPDMKLMYVGWTEGGQWFNVTFEVTETATYTLDLMHTSNMGGSCSVDFDGKNAPQKFDIPSTNDPKDTTGWRQWHHWNLIKDATEVKLEKGKHLMTFKVEDKGNMNLMYLDFRKKN